MLAAAEKLRSVFGAPAATAKRSLLARLGAAELTRPTEVIRLHELLCFWRAYADDRAVRRSVERLLAAFSERADLRRHAGRLADTGIAGTVIRFRFFAPTAVWLASRWPDRLRVDWSELDAASLEPWLPHLVHPAEAPALDEYDLPLAKWIARLKGPRESDAAFLVKRIDRLPMSQDARETLYDAIDPPLVLAPGPDTPSRTRASLAVRGVAISWQRRPLDRRRPTVAAIRRARPHAVRDAGPREAEALIDLARAAMVTRSRDLDAFSNGDPRDVRIVDCGEGLVFACIGTRPDRRLLLESVYGYLTLKNGVPIGYVLTAALFGSAELAYNVFDTYRDAEAGQVYGQVLGTARRLFGCEAFTIPPYQLGDGNDEALESGAWWFYQKTGFAPRDRAASRLMRRELARMRRDPAHRSSLATLRRLARVPMHFALGRPRADVMGALTLANVGLHVSHLLSRRFGHDREAATRVCATEAVARLGGGPDSGWSAEERGAWERWAPLVALLGVSSWTARERAELIAVIRAKGGVRESDYVRRFDRHAPLREGIHRLARRVPSP
jgi:hypothetical protein